jgi:hypothetical protein
MSVSIFKRKNNSQEMEPYEKKSSVNHFRFASLLHIITRPNSLHFILSQGFLCEQEKSSAEAQRSKKKKMKRKADRKNNTGQVLFLDIS